MVIRVFEIEAVERIKIRRIGYILKLPKDILKSLF